MRDNKPKNKQNVSEAITVKLIYLLPYETESSMEFWGIKISGFKLYSALNSYGLIAPEREK